MKRSYDASKRGASTTSRACAVLGVLWLGQASCAPLERPITENQEPVVSLTLPDDAVAGVPLKFSAEGTKDVDGRIEALRLDPGDGAEPVAFGIDDAEVTHVFDSPGLYTVAIVATDDGGLEGRARKPLRVLPQTPAEPPPEEPPPEEPPPEEPPVDPDADDDGDGLKNADDPAPAAYNGLFVEVFSIDAVPRDLLARQKAEDVVDALADVAPLATLPVTSGWASRASTSAALSAVFDGAPNRAEQFALRFTGTLTPPAGAAALEVELGADDLSVVFVDGAPVASADAEYALDFLRNDRVPAQSGPIDLYGPVELAIIVANDGGPYAWDVALRFLDASGASMDGAPTQASFLLP